MIPFTDERGYPVRLRRTGRMLGYLAAALPAGRTRHEFLVMPGWCRGFVSDADLHRPLVYERFTLTWDGQRGCLWADGSDFLRLEGATPF